MGTQIFQKSRSHLKILDARNMTLIKFRRTKFSHPGDTGPEILLQPCRRLALHQMLQLANDEMNMGE